MVEAAVAATIRGIIRLHRLSNDEAGPLGPVFTFSLGSCVRMGWIRTFFENVLNHFYESFEGLGEDGSNRPSSRRAVALTPFVLPLKTQPK